MKKSTVAFSALNLLGMICLVFWVLSARHLAVMEGRDSYDFGDSLGFLMFVIPVLFLCLVANIVWLAMAAVEIYRRRNYRSAAACMMMVLLWIAIVQVNRKLADLPSSQTTSTAN
jgi:hypothetical protein